MLVSNLISEILCALQALSNKPIFYYFQLISQPRFLQAIISAAFAYAIMAFLMTATPISMHIMEKINLGKTGIVIQFHIVAMFLPSLATGYLIKKYGHSNIMYFGVILF